MYQESLREFVLRLIKQTQQYSQQKESKVSTEKKK
jgi:hypothetical protein